ncbi:MAG: PLP-dependent cysteine synthase family protein [Candidatus Baldrarchaeia archaeon]
MKILNSILEAIGNTPMVRLNKVTRDVDATVLVKCEFLNPSGSIKDRVALRMINEAEKSGKIKPDGVIVESSTGNMAISLAFVSALKGYKAVMYMPKGWATKEKVYMLKAYGAEIREVSPGEEIERELKGKSVHGGVVELLPRKSCLEAEKTYPNTWWSRQALNFDNVLAHKEGTGKEILEQTDGKIDAFVAAIGTGGTLFGVGKLLKEKIPYVKIYGVEPADAPLYQETLTIRSYMEKYKIPGIESWIIEELKRSNLVDKCFLVKNQEAKYMADRLAKEEGLFVGMSSGANVYVALKVARELGKGKTIVTVLPDRRDRYFTLECFTT